MLTKPKWIVVNFSGGKDSTAMLLRMIELGEQIDEVICCDVGKEFPSMYQHIDNIKLLVESKGIKFTVLKFKYSFDHMMFEFQTRAAKSTGRHGKGWPTSRIRWCTGELKRDVTKRYLRALKKTHDVIECDGIASDEEYRLKRKNQQQSHKRHPLVEWGWTEKDCLEYCYAHGYTWDGLYDVFKRVSCWCCPLQSLDELRKLRRFHPDLWEELKDMDRRSWNKFRADYSVQDLEVRFELEKEFEQLGKPIRTKEFFDELKRRIA